MANWVVISVLLIFIVLAFTFIIPAFMGSPSASKEMTLERFCQEFGMLSRQKFFAGITQCYKTKTVGQTTTETACNVMKINSTWKFREACLIEMPAVNVTKR